MPVLHLIAGPNGVGKTMLYDYLIAPRHPELAFVNAQAYASAHLQHMADPSQQAHAARDWADAQREELLKQRRSFITETAFSHPSRLALISQARTLGFEVVLYGLFLDEPRHLLRRVNQRVREGGHDVPSHKVLERYTRCLDQLRHAAYLADLTVLLDAIEAVDGGPRLVASVVAGRMRLHSATRPRWSEKVLGFAEG